ncbi:sensor histidine kinase [Fibrella arboris]|uniref:sensor histidine kinase n=1 Tax=Fibrella arboris TaxID=3242486 RepID=UPI003521F7D8
MRLFPALSPDRVNRRIALSFLLAIILISVGFALSFYSYIRTKQDNERLSHTFEVINTLEDILSLTKDIETGTRGYLITRKTIFLDPCLQALPKIHPELTRLRALVNDNPQQQRATDTLSRLIDAKIEISSRQIRLNPRAAESIRQSYLLVGKMRMDHIRQQAAKMIDREQAFMKLRSSNAHRSFQNTLVLIFALSLLTFAVLLISYNLLDRELHRRMVNELQLRQYENQLQGKIQQLEISNQELERFAFVASHDMQEPLRKIQTFGDLLNQHYAPMVESDGRLYLSKMLTSADRMSKLIRDLLTFSRLKNQPDAFQRVSVGDVLDRVLLDLEVPIRTSGASITIGPMPVLDAVPSQLDQLFNNLIGNALKYTKPDTVPVISISADRIDEEADPGVLTSQPYYQLTVTDNGIGFNEKYLDRIFDVFQRLHAKAQYEGTGIGLAICKRVVAYHHGSITARSQEGIGTTFIITLPEIQRTLAVSGTEPAETITG